MANKSRLGNLEEIIEVEIPAHVKSINPGAFVGCVNLEKVKIWGTVCDVELSLGVASVSLNQSDFVEELKKGERQIKKDRRQMMYMPFLAVPKRNARARSGIIAAR